jgi:hypothetical protein
MIGRMIDDRYIGVWNLENTSDEALQTNLDKKLNK